ncbi:MAG: hypothetical protein ACAI35_14905 [Candidatus Methylacidiphilales bacterium]
MLTKNSLRTALMLSSCILAGPLLPLAGVRADVNSPAEFIVTADVAKPSAKVPPIGANDFGGPNGGEYAVNNFIRNGGNEPIAWKNMHRAMNVEGKSFELDGGSGKTSWYDLWNDGLFSGARVRVYRIVDKAGNPLPINKMGKYLELTTADRVVLVGTTHVIKPGEEGFPKGGWVVSEPPPGKKANRVYLAADSPDLAPFDYIVLDQAFDKFDMEWVHPRVRAQSGPKDRPNFYWDFSSPEMRLSIVAHPGKVPAEMAVTAGKGCMQIEAVAGENKISHVRFCGTEFGKESLYYPQLEPGKKYRLSLWMRQEGLGDKGQVHFGMSVPVPGHEGIEQNFDVTGEWARYTFDFEGPERPAKAKHYGPMFKFSGGPGASAGKLWMDNIRLFRYDSDADLARADGYIPNRTILNELVSTQPAAGEKGCHRVWVLDRDSTMDSLMSWYPSSGINPNWNTPVGGLNSGRTIPSVLTFDLNTGNSAATRMVPHIVIQHILHDEQDWINLMEYLSAPYNPAVDKPETKPFAYRRFQQRGTGTPWTDEFREIIIEFGNETWHNTKMKDWIGFALYGQIHQGGTEYGLFSQYLINNIKKSPYWASQKLDGKVHFCLGGNYSGEVNGDVIRGYAELAISRCPGAQYIGHANYFGPKWEQKQKPLTEFNDEGLFAMIMNYQIEIKPRQARMDDARQKLAARGVNYDVVAYEGGPSGYSIDRESRSNEGLVDAAENYGKSMGAAVCCIDTWFGSALQGWTYQDFFSFAQGRFWASHTMFSEGFRAHVPWLAMKLRNQYGSGDLMKVTDKQMPSITGPDGAGELPLIGVYAMRDEVKKQWSVFVISRKMNATVHGQSMGDGFSQVSLQLPFKSAEKVSLHKLCADPRANNRIAETVKIESQQLDAKKLSADGKWKVDSSTGGGAGGLPPGSIFVYVFEGTR